MDLKRFSLGKQPDKESAINNGSPRIKLGNYEFSIDPFEGTVICTSRAVKDSSGRSSNFTRGHSKYPFDRTMRCCSRIVPELNDILVLGALCEAMCKAAIPLNVLTENAELVEKFVKESLDYQRYSNSDYKFVLNRALELLNEEPEQVGESPLKN